MGKKIKLTSSSLTWIRLRANDPKLGVGGDLYNKLADAEKTARGRIFRGAATINLTDSEIETLRRILKREVDDPTSLYSTRRNSREALDELKGKARIKNGGNRQNLPSRKAPRITPKTPRLRR